MIKILIADDHAIVRKGLQQIIKEQAPYLAVDEAADGQAVLDKVRDEAWDILLLDISMPKLSGLEILREMKHNHPLIPVLILSTHPEEQYAVRVLRAGAAGYINKSCALDELVPAIEKVLEGGRYVSPTLAERLASDLNTPRHQLPHESLSNREYGVLLMLAEGKPVGKIAAELSLSPKTISTYRARILQKMQLHSNAELMRYVMDHQLS
jgi:two-component system, NarL family, invasion response regulator UvrY